MLICVGSVTFWWLLLARPITRIAGQLQGNYAGCFVDSDLDQKLEPILEHQRNLTIEICITTCYNRTHQTFAALNNGRACICRNSPGQQLHDRNCNVKCSGNQTQNCGENKNSIFYSMYTVCQIGYYGNKCDQVCQCRSQAPCDRMSGRCPNGCRKNWIGTTCNNAHLSEKYIGCFRDNIDRAISPSHDYSPQMTVESCTESCVRRNYPIVGLQAAGHCFCGESYAKYGRRSESDCSDPCPGNRWQKCGGPWANSVYSVCAVGFYGRNCVNRCHCYGNLCRFNGSCLNSTLISCRPGWSGSACTTRDCTINNGDCESDETCEIVDLGFGSVSACRCKNGFYRDKYTCRPSHLHYVGCYKGNTTQYVAVDLPTNDALTIEFCILKCKQFNKKYSLIQGGVTCLCGDDYGQVSLNDDCQVPCVRNNQPYCGGNTTVNGTPICTVYTATSFFRQYIGCYKDNITPAMEKKFSWQFARNNTIEACIRHCASLEFSYAGVQYGYDCFCGNSYDKYGPLTESSCNMSCHGNSSQMCGGRYANSVYAANDILWCSKDSHCQRNEVCNAIDLKYANVSRCRCIQGFYRLSKHGHCTDGDECNSGASKCNQTSEKCVNTIGSYRCECKAGFVKISGQCEDMDECGNDLMACDINSERCQNTIGSYLCHCKSGYQHTTFGNCADVDECHLDNTSSPCNAFSECVNSIGSYTCRCKENFVCGKGESADTAGQHFVSGICEVCSCWLTIGIVLGTFLAISLLINIFLVASRINKTKSTKPESGEGMTKSDCQRSSKPESDQHKNGYDEPPEPIGDDNVYEQIDLRERPAVVNKSSEYAGLKQVG